ncbi:MAG: TonB-dependent receptor [Fidelibacterota bacterium]
MKFKTVIFFSFLLLTPLLMAQEGSVRGYITDRETQSPLVGVNVIVENTKFGAASDITGQYQIDNLPAGTYNLSFQMMGYETVKKLNVPVNPDKSTRLDVELTPKSLQGETVIVTGKTFTKSMDATVSDMNLDFTELMNDPGSAMDVQRMMQALPSVVSGNDQDNEIIVRGGNPAENLFLIDNIEIPNPNHFGMQGSGGGPISMIDPLFLQEVDFYAGAFPAQFGGKASSVMNIKLKEGSRDAFHAVMDMGMAGIGMNLNGPVNDGRGSYMVGAHKSYLDLIAGGFGLTAIPKYYSLQGKFVYDLNRRNKLIVNGIYGNDKIYIKQDQNDGDVNEKRELVDFRGHTYASGISLRSLYNEHSYSLLTLSKVGKIWHTDVNEKQGDISDPVYRQEDHQTEWTLKGDYFNRINESNHLRLGFNLKSIQFFNDEWTKGDTLWNYQYYHTENLQQPVPFPGVNYDENQYTYQKDHVAYIHDTDTQNKTLSSFKTSLFAQYKLKPIKALEINTGIRYSYFEYSNQSYFSTRFGATYQLTGATSLNFGYGKHYQEPAFIYFANNPEKNKNLKSYHSNQYVLGMEHFFDESMKATVEVYHKNYRDMPVSRRWIEGDSIDYYEEELLSQQKAKISGIEFFLHKKMIEKLHFTLAYSYYVSQYEDLRPNDNKWYTGSYDFRNVLTFVSGYKINNRNKAWYQELKSKNWWKYVDWLLSPGDELELSARFRYSQGRPITQQHYDPYLRRWYTKTHQEINTGRLPDYHRLDIMINRRWILKNSAIVAYFNLMNVYNRQNVWGYAYNGSGTRDNIYQYAFTPVGGFIWEF